MAADYITVNRSKRLGDSLVRSANLLRELRELVDQIQDAGNHSNNGTDYSMLEANFGLPAGTGANTLALISLLGETLNTNVEKTGAVRLSQFDEFAARLAGQ